MPTRAILFLALLAITATVAVRHARDLFRSRDR